MLINRRQFLKGSAVVVPAATVMPAVFSRAVAASIHEQPSSAAPMGNRTLVIVQMAGGNDGLNTIVAHNDDKYYDLRGMLAIQPNDVLPIDREVGFHPGLSSLKELWDEGALGVVEGVAAPQWWFHRDRQAGTSAAAAQLLHRYRVHSIKCRSRSHRRRRIS